MTAYQVFLAGYLETGTMSFHRWIGVVGMYPYLNTPSLVVTSSGCGEVVTHRTLGSTDGMIERRRFTTGAHALVLHPL